MSRVDNSIVLSISIPTYNRPIFLRRNLESIFVLNTGNQLPIEVSVYDNSTTDDSKIIVNEFKGKGFKIRYQKNKESIPADHNVYQCYVRARGKYVLMLGDDDFFLPGALNKITEFLSRSEVGLVWLNHESTKASHSSTITKDLDFVLYPSGIDIIKKIHFYITFASVNIIRNPEIQEAISFDNPFLNFTHVPLILDSVFSGYDNYFCQSIVIKAQPNDAVNYNIVEVFSINLNKVIRISNLSASEKENVLAIINREVSIDFLPLCANHFYKKSSRDEKIGILSLLRNSEVKKLYYYIYMYPIISFPFPFNFLAYITNRLHVRCRQVILNTR